MGRRRDTSSLILKALSHFHVLLLVVVLLLLASSPLVATAQDGQQNAKPPHILFIMVDDAGVQDIGYNAR
jgi:hypothetical protein